MIGMSRWALFAVCVCAALAGWSQLVYGREREFLELTTPEFVVVSDLSDTKTRRVADDISGFQAVVALFTAGEDLKPKLPTRIYALSNRDWDDYARPWENVVGLFHPSAFANDIVFDAKADFIDASRTVFHEYLHYVLGNSSAFNYPAWYEEGLAEVLSTVEFSGDRVIVGRVPIDRWFTIGVSKWLPIQQMFAVRRDSPEYRSHKVAPAFYAQSWALIHYVMFENTELSKNVTAYVTAFGRGESPETAFAEAFGGDYTQLDAALSRYAHRPQFHYMEIKRASLSKSAPLTASIRKLTADESALELGEICLRLQIAPKRAEELFAGVTKRTPDDVRAVKGLALSLAAEDRTPEAEELLSTSLARLPGDAVLQQAQAFVLMQGLRAEMHKGNPAPAGTADKVKQVRELLRPAIKASNVPPETVAVYASTFIFDSDDDSEALALVQQALDKLPTSGELSYVQALLYARDGEEIKARDAWIRVATFARSELLRTYAQRMLNGGSQ
jgi:hypothetical protein